MSPTQEFVLSWKKLQSPLQIVRIKQKTAVPTDLSASLRKRIQAYEVEKFFAISTITWKLPFVVEIQVPGEVLLNFVFWNSFR